MPKSRSSSLATTRRAISRSPREQRPRQLRTRDACLRARSHSPAAAGSRPALSADRPQHAGELAGGGGGDARVPDRGLEFEAFPEIERDAGRIDEPARENEGERVD